MKNVNSLFVALIALGIGGIFTYLYLNWDEKIKKNKKEEPQTVVEEKTQEWLQKEAGQPVDLRYAAALAVKGVVHVKTQYTEHSVYRNPYYDFFFGQRAKAPSRQVRASGSGVILSSDGYIATNNHVIQNSEKIMVVLNDKRSFSAKLVGKDANTDLALLKIEAQGLDTISVGNSDKLSVGEWVLAVGNPFDLTSTVTAGIVSAKGRSISSLESGQLSIEAFIQTDAAVNRGNSGGALVNTQGELVGINTAIQSQTGAYIGYSFAIPSNIVAKITEDLKEYGSVQRGYLGIQIGEINEQIARSLGIDEVEGVIITEVNKGSAAQVAGLKSKDIIRSVNGRKIHGLQQFVGEMAKYSPGSLVKISVKRADEVKHFDVKLRSSLGAQEATDVTLLGAKLETIGEEIKQRLNITKGVIITQLGRGKLQDAGVQRGFVILSINNTAIANVSDVEKALKNNVLQGKYLIEGIYPNGQRAYYRF